MEEQGLWRLFFATGLPEAYLAIRAAERARETEQKIAAAFRPRGGRARQA